MRGIGCAGTADRDSWVSVWGGTTSSLRVLSLPLAPRLGSPQTASLPDCARSSPPAETKHARTAVPAAQTPLRFPQARFLRGSGPPLCRMSPRRSPHSSASVLAPAAPAPSVAAAPRARSRSTSSCAPQKSRRSLVFPKFAAAPTKVSSGSGAGWPSVRVGYWTYSWSSSLSLWLSACMMGTIRMDGENIPALFAFQSFGQRLLHRLRSSFFQLEDGGISHKMNMVTALRALATSLPSFPALPLRSFVSSANYFASRLQQICCSKTLQPVPAWNPASRLPSPRSPRSPYSTQP